MPYTIDALREPGLAIHAKKVYLAIMDKVRGYGNSQDVITVAYLFYKLSTSDDNKLHSPFPLDELANMQWDRFMRGEIPLNPYILSSLHGGIKKCFINAYKVYEDVGRSDIIYAALIVLFDDYISANAGKSEGEKTTPNSLVELTQSILRISGNEKVADICCGNGNFIMRTAGIEPNANYYGYEINLQCAAVLAMKSDVLGVNIEVKMGDIEYTLSDKKIKFDKIFSNYPINMKLDRYDEISQSLPFWISRNSSDWYFNNIVINHLSKSGKAVVITGVGSTWNIADKEARKYFVENGFIEAVINLPAGLSPYTSIPLTAYVFSHNNEKIKLIDAEDIVTERNRYFKTLTDNNIKDIIDLLKSDSEKSVSVTKEDIKNKDYSLAFRTYRSGLPKYKNGTPLSEVATIIRGVLYPRSNATVENTGKYLLQISDFEDGSIKNNLGNDRFVKSEKDISDQKLLPYDIIISRSAQPIKIAVVSPDEKRELYPNGNMFIIRVDKSSVNPYYLLSFLLSGEGQEALRYATTGNVLKTISVGSLSELVFPLKEAREQRAIAEKVVDSITRYRIYSLKASKAKDDIENAYYSEGE